MSSDVIAVSRASIGAAMAGLFTSGVADRFSSGGVVAFYSGVLVWLLL